MVLLHDEEDPKTKVLLQGLSVRANLKGLAVPGRANEGLVNQRGSIDQDKHVGHWKNT